LTPTPFVVEPLDAGLPKLAIFGTLASIEEVTMGLLEIELSFIDELQCQMKFFILSIDGQNGTLVPIY